ncbi:hypothetical protein SAMN05421797_1011463 [Maribacter ulvicola]|uniref:Uncharacterized protein n=1 Tax=Maribacter ulvicola TaxID=228959 RepID=A0A1N6S012_9FLAO|nr:hypothetical protein SAMN05421797_1011463 [Maribacter ulvicola]
MKVMAIGAETMLMSVFIFTIMDGTTGVMAILMDGVGTILAMPDIMVTAGVNLGDGTDGTTGDIQVSDLDMQV